MSLKVVVSAGLVALLVVGIVLFIRSRGAKPPTADQLADLTPEQVADIDPELLAKVDPAAIAALTPAQIAELTTAQIEKLTEDQIEGLRPEQVEALVAPSFNSPDADAIATIRPEILALVPLTNINQLDTSQIDALTEDQIEAISADSLSASAPDVLIGLKNEIFTRINPSKLSELSITQIAGIVVNYATIMTATQIAAFKNAPVITSLTIASQLSALGNNVIFISPFLSELQVKLITREVISDAEALVNYLLYEKLLATVETVAWIDSSQIVKESCDNARLYTSENYAADVKAAFLARCTAKNL